METQSVNSLWYKASETYPSVPAGIPSVGVPYHNNRELLSRLQSEFPSQETYLPVIDELLKRPRLRNSNASTMKIRLETREMLKMISTTGLISGRKVAFEFYKEPMPEIIAKLGLVSASLATLLWVHYALWMVSVIKLGTEKHHAKYEAQSDLLDMVGCCLMTEDGGGSDVANLQCSARFVPGEGKGHFLIETLTPAARKIWAGGLGQIASSGVLFARLGLPGSEGEGYTDMGGHAFAIDIREDGKLLPGLIVGEMGKWVGKDHTGRKHVLIHCNDPRIKVKDSIETPYPQINNIHGYALKRNPAAAHKYRIILEELAASKRIHVPLDGLPKDLARILDDSEEDEGCGRKIGLNGVDNGWVCFDQFKVPYDALLDHYCEVTPNGEYIGKNGHKATKSKTLIYKLMAQFVRGRQIISVSSASGFRLLSQIVFSDPPVKMPAERHRHAMLRLLSCSYALESALPMIMSEETIDDHITASGMKAIASWMLLKGFGYVLRLYGQEQDTAAISTLLVDYMMDQFATVIYEGANDVLLQLAARDLAIGMIMSPPEWLDEVSKIEPQDCMGLEQHLLNIPEPCERALFIMRHKMFCIFKQLEAIIMPFVSDPSRLKQLQEFWMANCAGLGAQLALMSIQCKITERFWLTAKEREAKEGNSIYRDLALYYAEQSLVDLQHFHNVGEEGVIYIAEPLPGQGRHDPVPYNPVENHCRWETERRLEQAIPELVARISLPMEYLEALLPDSPNDSKPGAKL